MEQPMVQLLVGQIIFCYQIVRVIFHANRNFVDEKARFDLKWFEDRFEGMR